MDVECLALKKGLDTSSTKFCGVHSGAQLGNSLTKDTDPEPFASFLRNGNVGEWYLTRGLCFRGNVELWDQYTRKTK